VTYNPFHLKGNEIYRSRITNSIWDSLSYFFLWKEINWNLW